MKKFPTPFRIYNEIDKNYRYGLTLTQIVEKTHPTFNITEYRKDGHRALIRETLVKTGSLTKSSQTKGHLNMYLQRKEFQLLIKC